MDQIFFFGVFYRSKPLGIKNGACESKNDKRNETMKANKEIKQNFKFYQK